MGYTCRDAELEGETVDSHKRSGAFLLVTLVLSVGCTSSIGPRTVPHDQFNYAEALREAWKEQLLLNMVGLRYAEAPMFLKVTSVINQYTYGGQAAASTPGYNQQSVVSPPLTIGGQYTDRPTITYLPLSGPEFTRSVLTPIPPASIMSLVQAGWRIDLLFRLTVRAINGISASETGVTRPDDERYYELMSLLVKVQEAGELAFRVEHRDKGDAAIIRIEDHTPGGMNDSRRRIEELLGLAPGETEYSLVFGHKPSNDREIAMLTRSILEMMAELAMWVDVPPEHVASGRTSLRPSTEAMQKYDFKPLIAVHSSVDPPSDPFVAVRYDGLWFWIDHNDFRSKKTLGFMQIMFSLAESSGGQTAPVVTVQAGG